MRNSRNAIETSPAKACESCGASLAGRHWHTRFCFDCSEKRGRQCQLRRNQLAPDIPAAHRAVAKSIRDGLLRPADERLCVDCLKPAEVYEHRDYRYPLEVEPVCRSCNKRRGPGYPYNTEPLELVP